MKPTKVMMISAFITTVILVAIVGVTFVVLANQRATARVAAYEELIKQANVELETANSNLLAMQAQLQSTAATAVVDTTVSQPAAVVQVAQAAPEVSYAVSSEQADQLAAKVAELGQKQLKNSDLVDFEGKAAYEVVFEKGSIYVDAQSGDILFNGTIPQVITAEKAAQVAGDYLNNKNILQVDQVHLGATPLFRVIFQNGTMAYLDLTGQIINIQPAQPAGASDPQLSSSNSGGDGGGSKHSSEPHETESGD
jgi:hypothetical protein